LIQYQILTALLVSVSNLVHVECLVDEERPVTARHVHDKPCKHVHHAHLHQRTPTNWLTGKTGNTIIIIVFPTEMQTSLLEMNRPGSLRHKGLYRRVTVVRLPRPSPCNPCMHAPAACSYYWRPTLVIACSPLDAGQPDVMIDRPIADFRDKQ